MSLTAPAARWRGLVCDPERSTQQVLGWLGLVALGGALATAPLEWASKALAGAGLLLGILIVPAIAVIAVAFLIPFGGQLAMPGTGASVVDLLVLAAVTCWALDGLRRRSVVFEPPALTWPLLAFIWIAALSLTQAFSWREGLPEWLKWAEFAAVYLISTQTLNRRQAWWAIAALFAAGLSQVALGAYQFLGQVGPEPFVLFGRFMRAHGTFGQPNPYAGYLGYLAPVAVSLAFGGLGRWWQDRRRTDLWIGSVCGAVAVGLATGIGMSWSRGGWLGLAGGLLVVAGLRNRKTMLWTGLGIAIIIALILLLGTGWLPDSLVGRVDDLGQYLRGSEPTRTEITDATFSVLERLAHWQAGLQMFADHPWLGVGIGNYGVAYANYAPPHWYEALGHAHNIYINFLAETGVLGAGAFGIVWLGAIALVWRTARRTHGNSAALAIGLLGGLAYLSVHNLFDNLFVQHMQLQLALLLGALVVIEKGTS